MRYYAVTKKPLPQATQGAEAEIAIRALAADERFAIEDFFFRKDLKVSLSDHSTAVVIDDSKVEKHPILEEIAVFAEFGLALLSVTGFEGIEIMAVLNASGDCVDSFYRPTFDHAGTATFPQNLTPGTSNIWFRQILSVRKSSKDRLHVTADRFVRYSRVQDTQDALLDLCICLESLLDTTTEISFRFGVCLAKVTGHSDAEELSHLLSDLYSLRSNMVHGADASKVHKKIDPHLSKLRLAARTILTNYLVYLTNHSKEEWKKHLRSSLFS